MQEPVEDADGGGLFGQEAAPLAHGACGLRRWKPRQRSRRRYRPDAPRTAPTPPHTGAGPRPAGSSRARYPVRCATPAPSARRRPSLPGCIDVLSAFLVAVQVVRKHRGQRTILAHVGSAHGPVVVASVSGLYFGTGCGAATRRLRYSADESSPKRDELH